jgi:hypothetical protein
MQAKYGLAIIFLMQETLADVEVPRVLRRYRKVIEVGPIQSGKKVNYHETNNNKEHLVHSHAEFGNDRRPHSSKTDRTTTGTYIDQRFSRELQFDSIIRNLFDGSASCMSLSMSMNLCMSLSLSMPIFVPVVPPVSAPVTSPTIVVPVVPPVSVPVASPTIVVPVVPPVIVPIESPVAEVPVVTPVSVPMESPTVVVPGIPPTSETVPVDSPVAVAPTTSSPTIGSTSNVVPTITLAPTSAPIPLVPDQTIAPMSTGIAKPTMGTSDAPSLSPSNVVIPDETTTVPTTMPSTGTSDAPSSAPFAAVPDDTIAPTSSIIVSDAPSSSPAVSTSMVPSVPLNLNCASKSKSDALLDILTPVSSEAALTDPATPQGSAFAWLANSPDFDPCTYPTVEQRFALATFYQSTAGSTWRKNEDWLTELSECEWFGATCSNDGYIQELSLSKFGRLSGN